MKTVDYVEKLYDMTVALKYNPNLSDVYFNHVAWLFAVEIVRSMKDAGILYD